VPTPAQAERTRPVPRFDQEFVGCHPDQCAGPAPRAREGGTGRRCPGRPAPARGTAGHRGRCWQAASRELLRGGRLPNRAIRPLAFASPRDKTLGYDIIFEGNRARLAAIPSGGAKVLGESKDGVVKDSNFEDLAAQIAAAEKLLDRIYGAAEAVG
jgi:hypothetical protein